MAIGPLHKCRANDLASEHIRNTNLLDWVVLKGNTCNPEWDFRRRLDTVFNLSMFSENVFGF